MMSVLERATATAFIKRARLIFDSSVKEEISPQTGKLIAELSQAAVFTVGMIVPHGSCRDC